MNTATALPETVDVALAEGHVIVVEMMPVASSQIEALGYHEPTQTLVIEFKRRPTEARGSIYRYANVAPETFTEFIASESVGSYFYRHIKPATDKYPYVRVASAVREEA